MKLTELIMGMPITVEIIGANPEQDIELVFDYFRQVDERYSTYKPESEISRINRGLPRSEWSDEVKHVLELCEETKRQTHGYFDIKHKGLLDPSGLVKGWAIHNASLMLLDRHRHDFYIEAGGDVQVHGRNADGNPWAVGIRNPFATNEIIKVVRLHDEAVATSGTYIRGEHIYNPHNEGKPAADIVSLTVIGPNIYEADRFATAVFAMGREGISFIEQQPGLEGYMVDHHKIATYTSGFERYVFDETH